MRKASTRATPPRFSSFSLSRTTNRFTPEPGISAAKRWQMVIIPDSGYDEGDSAQDFSNYW
jgi:hypothetical protein